MMPRQNAALAYRASRAALPPKAQEADVFRRVIGVLRAARGPDGTEGMAAVRAIADNRRLWMTVEGMLMDPTNALPAPLRASIISVGRTVLREMEKPEPDFDFLIEVNENIAAGLEGAA